MRVLQRPPTYMAEFQSDGMAGPADVTVTQMPASAGVMNGGGNGGEMFLDNGVASSFQNSKKGLLQQQQQSRGLHHQSAAMASSSAASTQQSSNQQTSSSSQMLSSSTSSLSASASSRLSKRSQLMTHSLSTSEMNVKQQQQQQQLQQQQAAAALATSTTSSTASSTTSSTTSNTSSFAAESSRSAASTNFARSMSLGGGVSGTANLCGPGGVMRLAGGPQRVFSVERPAISEVEEPPLVQMPDDDDDCAGTPSGALALNQPQSGGFVAAAAAAASSLAAAAAAASSSCSEMKFSEQKQQQTCSSSKMQMSSDGAFVAETLESVNRSGQRRMQAGDVTVEERRNQSALKGALQTESFSAQKTANVMQEQFQITSGEVTQQEQRSAATATVKLQADNFTAEKAVAKQAERQIISAHGVTHQETHMASSSSSKFSTFTSSKGISSSSSLLACQMGANKLPTIEYDPEWKATIRSLDTGDLNAMTAESTPEEVGHAVARYTQLLGRCVERLRAPGVGDEEAGDTLNAVDRIIRCAWGVATHGHAIGSSLCNAMRTNNGLDQLVINCGLSVSAHVQFLSVRVLEQCLTTENRAHVVDTGLDPVVRAARHCSMKRASLEHMRAGTGVLEHLFKHSEATCSQVVRLGGLDVVVGALKEGDTETLRHCAGALTNLSLYGGPENQLRMVQKRVPAWLFPLAMHEDDNIKYYACLAVAALVANKEIEADVLRSATLARVEPFIQGHSPTEFAGSCVAHAHGQSRDWLQRLVPVLLSKPKEGHTLAAFHFAMEAGIKKRQGNMRIFHEIGAIEPLKKVASCPNALASRLAAQALRLIGEEIPHKLSQQVPLWTVEDVNEWLKQIGFVQYAPQFVGSRVDGDLLLQLSERMLLDDIGITNGILRKRFMRELGSLKKMTDYSSCDASNLNSFLLNIGADMTQYTYPLLNTGVDKDMLRYLTDEQLLRDCAIDNSIHRLRIMDGVRACTATPNASDVNIKNLDVFISYRRSNGSQLASLLKVHLELKGFTVFIDVERLEAGKFDNNLLQSIRQAKHFILVLTPNALERCIGDEDNKDWVHREIVGALESQCNIIPITDNFQWPDPEQLPEDMRAVSYFNGVRWIHDYQDACVDKLERFLKGDTKGGDGGHPGRYANLGGGGTPGTPSTVHGGRQGPYVRSHSNESKGSVSSDKETAASSAVATPASAITNGQAVLVNGPSVVLVE